MALVTDGLVCRQRGDRRRAQDRRHGRSDLDHVAATVQARTVASSRPSRDRLRRQSSPSYPVVGHAEYGVGSKRCLRASSTHLLRLAAHMIPAGIRIMGRRAIAILIATTIAYLAIGAWDMSFGRSLRDLGHGQAPRTEEGPPGSSPTLAHPRDLASGQA